MAFTDQQRQALKAKLRYRHVRTRASNGTPISYVEGWHVIAEANRIFGYDSWDRQTLSPRCLWRETQRGEAACFYAAKVRVTVRAGEAIIVREGIGTGFGRSRTAETAHEIALKAAETDATKRALATFGNPFGLALYDKELKGVTRRPQRDAAAPDIEAPAPTVAFDLLHSDARTERFTSAEAFVVAAVQAVRALTTVEAVYAFWEANLDSFAALPRAVKEGGTDPVAAIGSSLKEQVRTLARQGNGHDETRNGASSDNVDTTVGRLAFPKENRIRDKAHLAFVAREPCLVCGRRPAQAHHIRFAQPSALGLKVSDEFTVPLCNGHHDSLHQTGDERAWWARHGILDPLQLANRLWATSRRNKCDGEPQIAAASNGRPTLDAPTDNASDEPPW
jgi:DNA recombination protein Rad52